MLLLKFEQRGTCHRQLSLSRIIKDGSKVTHAGHEYFSNLSILSLRFSQSSHAIRISVDNNMQNIVVNSY